MAINPAPAKSTAPVTPPPAPAAPKDESVLLELRNLARYRREGSFYEKGVAYKFTKEQAIILLDEELNGVAIWKRTSKAETKAKAVIAQPEKRIVDATADKVNENTDEDGVAIKPKGEALEIGTDDEIQDILGMVEADHSEDADEVETV